jgi:uncharacterized membrane protein YbhN (UPF0104 family)
MTEKLKKYKWIFQLAISISVAIYVYNKVDFNSLILSFKELPWFLLLIIPIVGLLQFYVTTIMQLKLFSIYSTDISKTRTFRENFVAAFYGMALPGLVGSDLYLVNYFGKKVNSYFNAFIGIFFLRILGLIVFITFITLSFFFLNKSTYQLIRGFNLDIKISIVFVLMASIVILIIGYFTIRFYFKTAYKKVLAKLNPLINLIKIEKNKVFLIIFQIVLYYIVAIGGRAWIAKICGIDIPIIELSALIMIVNLLIMLPVSYIGIGVREGGYIGLLVLLNIEKSKAVLFSIMDFSITIFVFTIGALISLIWTLLRKKSPVLCVFDRERI